MARRSGKPCSSTQVAIAVTGSSSTQIAVAGTGSSLSVQISTSAPASVAVAVERNDEKAIRHSNTGKRNRRNRRNGQRLEAATLVHDSTMTQTRTRQPSAPEFTRRGPYYETSITDDPEYTYLEASDVERQVLEAPTRRQSQGGYPKAYRNDPPLPLSSPGPHLEYPIVPSPRLGQAGVNYQRGSAPGPVRAIFNETDRSRFDVGFHDDTKAPPRPQKGKGYQNSPFSLATYHPGGTDVCK
ncbi:hypothetical protein PG988_002345 [Apiospora saccharicola]